MIGKKQEKKEIYYIKLGRMRMGVGECDKKQNDRFVRHNDYINTDPRINLSHNTSETLNLFHILFITWKTFDKFNIK